MLAKEKKREVIAKYQNQTFDTGSCEVQIALTTARIQEIMEHLRKNKKDNSAKRGLQQLVSTRKKLMRYLKASNIASYASTIASLGIRG